MKATKWFTAIFFCMLLTGCAELENIETTQEDTERNHNQTEVIQSQLAESLKLELITVGRVIDGDTFETSDGRKVRLVGVNTPESTSKVEEYGKNASNYTVSKLNEKQVWIQKDVSDTDRYNRSLRIVWLEIPTDDMDENEIRTKMFNADLVLNGYAEPSSYPPDIKYSDYFVKFAREARHENTGLWAFGEEGTTKGDLDTKLVDSSNNSSSSSDSNSDSTTTSSKTYVFYKNCTALREVYPDGVPSWHPAYASKHDRDKDNWACER
ncbi:thermonuclease family protein [Metabacillus herbersteinensis]|uniref:Thermonuclease family protein n=1 Tax=Metabacillus herbersteinensis TaxID=283816 RepID=A0ABV6GAB8_9BACI